jgi:hypothetical protein
MDSHFGSWNPTCVQNHWDKNTQISNLLQIEPFINYWKFLEASISKAGSRIPFGALKLKL